MRWTDNKWANSEKSLFEVKLSNNNLAYICEKIWSNCPIFKFKIAKVLKKELKKVHTQVFVYIFGKLARNHGITCTKMYALKTT